MSSSVHQLKSGKWRARVRIDGIEKAKSCATKQEAEAAIPILEELISTEKRLKTPVKSITVENMFERMFAHRQRGKRPLAPQSLLRLQNTVGKYITPVCGYMRVIDITEDEINETLEKPFYDGKSFSTIKKIYDAWNACMRYAVLEEIIPRNPVDKVDMYPKSAFTKRRTEVFSREEVAALVEECGRKNAFGYSVHRYGDLFLLILHTGLREGEACALMKSDIRDGNLYVTKTAVTMKEDDKYVTRIQDHPKTARSARVVPLNDVALEIVERLLKDFPDGDLLVYTGGGNIIPPASLAKAFAKLKGDAGVNSRGGVHALRSCFATYLFEARVDIQTVSMILGHSSTKVTEEYYVKILQDRKLDAVRRIGDIYRR